MHILVTGGAGFIGSHTCVVLLDAGHEVTIVDNFVNSDRAVVDRLSRITGRRPTLVEADVRDQAATSRIFCTRPVDAVIHFAGLKAVGESVADPLRYWDNNVGGSMALLESMTKADVKTLVFSSSATVYGSAAPVPYREDMPLAADNPYGRGKQAVELMLEDLAVSDASWRIARLRYFNPVGAHPSALIGESPRGIPNNLMPYIAQVANGEREALAVFGNDYPTADGTGVRDYIHVVDLAEGHLAALEALKRAPGLLTVNLGTGRGFSVLEMIAAFERASGRPVPYRIAPRRPGDLPSFYADPSLAGQLLGWHARLGIDAMCADAWRWECNKHGD